MKKLLLAIIAVIPAALALSQNVGIGTNTPTAYLEISGSVAPQLIIKSAEGSNRPGIQFKNNNIHYISGDDMSEETFGFYSKFGNQRTYGTSLQVYGPAASSWGTYIGLKHDGAKGILQTDVGDLILLKGPNAKVGIGIDAPQRLVTIDGSNMPSEIQFVNNASGKTANDGATIGIIPSTPHASFWNYENADLYFGTNNTRYLSIKPDGKIGIGINNPTATLHIQSNSSVTVPGLLLTETDDDYGRLMFKNSLVPSKYWLINAGVNSNDIHSRFNLTYYNGVNTPKEIIGITSTGELQSYKTGSANLLPVAYGKIRGNGTKVNGTNNFTSVRFIDPITNETGYYITITGIEYNEDLYMTLVTPGSSHIFNTTTGYSQGVLIVWLRDKNVDYTTGYFSFIVYKF